MGPQRDLDFLTVPKRLRSLLLLLLLLLYYYTTILLYYYTTMLLLLYYYTRLDLHFFLTRDCFGLVLRMIRHDGHLSSSLR